MTFNDYIQLFLLKTSKSQKWAQSIVYVFGVEKYI